MVVSLTPVLRLHHAKMLLLAALCAISACTTARTAPAPPTSATLPKIIALGDMHGDYAPYQALMREAGLIDAKGNWSGGDTIFVQTGDIPDRGSDTRKIIESLQRLEQQAPLSDGKVIPMVGNHEAMNVYRDLRYVHPGEIVAFADDNSEKLRADFFAANREQIEAEYRAKRPELTSLEIKEKWDDTTPLGMLEHAAAWGPSGYIGKWVAGNKVVVSIYGYLFAHGGYSQEYSQLSLADMNGAAADALSKQDRSRGTILRDSLGPLWYRGNVRGRPEIEGFDADGEIDLVLQRFGATHIIVGHTRSEKGIRVSRDGRLIQIDTGASAVYGGVPSFLRIENGQFFAHTLGGFEELTVAATNQAE